MKVNKLLGKRFYQRLLVLSLGAIMLVATGCAATSSTNDTHRATTVTNTINQQDKFEMKTKILFINTSRDPQGNTAKMGDTFFGDVPHDTLFLNNYKVYQLGQEFPDDQFNIVYDAMKQADIIVIGTPVYWHTMSGGLKTLIDRMYELPYPDPNLEGKSLYFLMQGMNPSAETREQLPYTMTRVAKRYGMEYMGAARDAIELPILQKTLFDQVK